MVNLSVDLLVNDRGSNAISNFSNSVVSELGVASESSLDFSNTFVSGLGGIAGASGTVVAGVLAIGTALSSITISTAQEQKELAALAQRTRESVEEFQALALATSYFSEDFDAKGLADIGQDVFDRLGDYAITGAGPFIDYMEQVAIKLGKTVGDYANLGGIEALQVFKNEMDLLGKTYEEQVFLLESISSNASRLIPLLAENGRLLKFSTEQAKEFSVVISETDSEKLLEVDRNVNLINLSFKGVKNVIASEVAPTLSAFLREGAELIVSFQGEIGEVVKGFVNVARSIGGVIEVASGRLSFIDFAKMDAKELESYFDGTNSKIRELRKELSDLKTEQKGFEQFGSGGIDTSAVNNRIKILEEELKAETNLYTETLQNRKDLFSLQIPETQSPKLEMQVASKAEVSNNKEYSNKLNEQLSLKEDLTQKINELTLSESEYKIWSLDQEINKMRLVAGERGELQGQIDQLEKLKLFELEENQKEEIVSAYTSILSSVDEISSEMYEILKEKYIKDRDDFISVTNDKEIAYKIYNDKIKDLDNQRGENEKSIWAEMDDASGEWLNQNSSSFTSLLLDADTTFSSILDSFINMLSEMVVQTLIVKPILEWLSGIMSGVGGSGGLIGGLFGFHSGGVIGTDSPTFTRQIPKMHTGGIVGQNEQLTILENGEGVFTQGQMQQLGMMATSNTNNSGSSLVSAPVFNMTINNNSESNVTSDEKQNDSGGLDIDIMIDQSVAKNMRRHGSATNSAMKASTGTSTQIKRR